MSEVSNTASRIDAEATSNTISTTGINPLDCALDVLQLLQLQQWVEEQINLQ
jgi:hypothetical protein